MMTYALSFFTGKQDTQPQPKRATWQELCRLLTHHETRQNKDGRLFSPASYPASKTRAKANVEAVSLLVLDFDDGTPPLPLMKQCRAGGIACIIHSSYSSSRLFPKWRAVIPLARPVPADQWEPLFLRMAEHFGNGHIDASCKDASRMFYLPACPVGAEADAFAEVIEGEPFNPVCLPDPEPEQPIKFPEPTPSKRFTRTDGANLPTAENLISRALQQSATGRNNAGLWLATQLRDNDFTPIEAEAVMMRYQSQVEGEGKDAYTKREALDTLRKAFARPKREAWGQSFVSDEEIQEAEKTNGTESDTIADAVPKRDEDEPAAPILRLRQTSLARHLSGIADVVPYGGLRYSKEVTEAGVRKASKTLRQFYGKIDNAMKFDMIDTYFAALNLAMAKYSHNLPKGIKGRLKQELFGRWRGQVGNWISDIGLEFAENKTGRRRPHLPLRVHAAVKNCPYDVQDKIFDTVEGDPKLTDEKIAEMIAILMPKEETEIAQEAETDKGKSSPLSMPRAVTEAEALHALFSRITPEDNATLERYRREYGRTDVNIAIQQLLPTLLHSLVKQIPDAIQSEYKAISTAFSADENLSNSSAEKNAENANFEMATFQSSEKWKDAKAPDPMCIVNLSESEEMELFTPISIEADSWGERLLAEDAPSSPPVLRFAEPVPEPSVPSIPDELPETFTPYHALIDAARSNALPRGKIQIAPHMATDNLTEAVARAIQRQDFTALGLYQTAWQQLASVPMRC
jgi:hypothetical protein